MGNCGGCVTFRGMSTTPPQFGTAEYKSATGGDQCKACKQPITGSYYRVNSVLACAACTDKVQAQMPKDTHVAFMRGILFGVGGAIAGLIVYSAFGIITGIVIGYVSLAVGWLVGKAMRAGSKGIGGRRYQIAAVALTYGAVSLSAIPIGISQIVKEKKEPVAVTQAPSQGGGSDSSDVGASAGSAPGSNGTAGEKSGFGAAISALLFAGLASPFLELGDGIHGVIGLVILFVGMQIAWKLTAAPKLEILGPFKADTPVAATP